MSNKLVVRTGTDIVNEQDLVALADNQAALEKYFSPAEIMAFADRRQDRVAALARTLAAKEALLKAAGRSLSEIRKIEVQHSSDGRPVPKWDYLTENQLSADVSVSSSSPFAIAVAVIVDQRHSS